MVKKFSVIIFFIPITQKLFKSFSDGSRELVTTCELIVLMLSDNLIAESVTLSLPNLEIKIFLNLLYDRLITSLLSILSKSSMVIKIITSSSFKII
jgi:hypothetical protein